jgi:signal transduction histidine kinase
MDLTLTRFRAIALGAKTVWWRHLSSRLRAVSWDFRRFDALLPWGAGLVVFLLSFLSPQHSHFSGHSGCWSTCLNTRPIASVWVVVVAALCGLATAIARRVQWPLYATAALGWFVYGMWAAVGMASYYAGLKLTRRGVIAYLLLALASVIVPVIVGMRRNELPWRGAFVSASIGASMIVLLPYIYGRWVRGRRREQAALQESRAAQAKQAERSRIAAEMHDVVAHRVALMVLHAGALELGAKDERTVQTAGLIRREGREALTELRQTLGALRGPPEARPQPTLADIPALVEHTVEAGVPVTLQLRQDDARLPSTVQRTAYRVVQEGLTNVVKHAGSASTEVLVRQGDSGLEITVRNGPPPSEAAQLPGSGFGLIGLRERVALVGGRLEATPSPDGGFLLRAHIPLHTLEEIS